VSIKEEEKKETIEDNKLKSISTYHVLCVISEQMTDMQTQVNLFRMRPGKGKKMNWIRHVLTPESSNLDYNDNHRVVAE
jgi:hypothetical protein